MGLRIGKRVKRWLLLILLGLFSCFLGMTVLGKAVPACSGRSNPERIAFLERNGWEVAELPTASGRVRIPLVFDEVYQNYSRLQREQGFHLENYAGEEVERYQYAVTNYPNYSGEVRANLLIFEGNIIAGDICSLELGGFMHGIVQKSGEK